MKKERNLWTKLLFAVYLLLLVWAVLLKLEFSFAAIYKMREVNWIPFYYKDVYEGDFPIYEAVLNLLIFVPFGFYLKMLGADHKKIILSGFLTSLLFELLQFVFRLGATDITDLITNTAGTAAGLYFYVLLCKLFKNRGKMDTALKVLATIVTGAAVSAAGLLALA